MARLKTRTMANWFRKKYINTWKYLKGGKRKEARDMATCANCIHHSLCDYNTNVSGNGKIRLVYAEGSEKCSFFQNTADVVPKSEVDKLKIEIEALKIANEKMYAANKEQQAEIDSFLESVDELQADKADVTYFKKQLIANAKSEVAREIFAEIVREVYYKIPDKILPITIVGMSNTLGYEDGLNFGSRNAYFDTLKIIAELKKKYTEGET